MALDTTTPRDDDDAANQSGPATTGVPEKATEDRFYELAERSLVLVRQGAEVPRRLLRLPYTPAVLRDGVYVPASRKRGKR